MDTPNVENPDNQVIATVGSQGELAQGAEWDRHLLAGHPLSGVHRARRLAPRRGGQRARDQRQPDARIEHKGCLDTAHQDRKGDQVVQVSKGHCRHGPSEYGHRGHPCPAPLGTRSREPFGASRPQRQAGADGVVGPEGLPRPGRSLLPEG